MVSSFAFVVIKGPSLIKIISARNQDIIMVYEAVIKVDIYGVGLATVQLSFSYPDIIFQNMFLLMRDCIGVERYICSKIIHL
jgi:hypothetical protein